MLKFGPGNNFMRFKEALSKKALEKYGRLGKLINMGKFDNLEEPDRTFVDLRDEFEKADYLEAMKTFRKQKLDREEKEPQLYALILKYLSEESLEVVQKHQDWADIEANVNPVRLWNKVEDKHRVHSTSEVAAIVKLETRNQLKNLKQGAFESIITYKKRYNDALKAYHDHDNPTKDGAEQGMDFFDRLDNGRYADFKVQYLNGLQIKTITAPTDLNTVFNLANNWLEPKALPGGGYASTYATKVDKVEKKSTPKGETKNNTGKQQETGKTEGKVESERKPRTNRIECFICGNDHYATDCPHRKKLIESNKVKTNDEEKEAAVNAVWEANAFVMIHTYQINAVGFSGFRSTEVLLDNQADVSIIWPELLRQVQPSSEVVWVNGVGGVQLELQEMGYLDNFFQVYMSTQTRVNVLSFLDVEELYPITYEPFVGFTIHTPKGDILFEKKGKLHVADFAAYGNILATQVYTKAEMARAHAVRDLVRNTGYPSYQEVVNLIQDGNFSHLPNLTAKDVQRAYDFFGKSAAFIRGRMTKQVVKRAVVDDDLVLEEKNLVLHSDVIHVDRNMFLVTVCNPLQLTVQVHIERESHSVLGMALQGQLELLHSKGFKPTHMYVDPQSALRSLDTKFPNVSIDVAGYVCFEDQI